MRRLTVLHSVYSWLPVTQNWVYTQIIRNSGCEAAVASITEEGTEQFPYENRATAFRGRSITARIGAATARYWIRQPRAFFIREIARIHPDVVHGHFAPESWRILPFVRNARIPLVTTFYGLDVEKLPRRRRWRQRYQKLFSYGDAFTVEGPFMEKRLAETGCAPEKIHVIPLGVDDVFATMPQRDKSSDESVHVLFTGLGREKKGPLDAARIFIDAARAVPKLHLSVVGDGRYRLPFERKVRDAGFGDRVTFHGYCSLTRYRELLAGSDVVLVPSVKAHDGDTEGGAPVVSIEAQLAGVPVVGTRHCDIPFIVHHDRGGLLSAEHDTMSMARDLVGLAENAHLRKSMGEYGRRHALRQHSVDRQIAAITALYRSVVAGNRAKGAVDG